LAEEAEGVIFIGLCNIEELFLLERTFGEEEGSFKMSFIFGNLLYDEELHESGVIGVLFEFNIEEMGVVF
jgi:hypothetical protein